MSNFVINIVAADGMAPVGAKTFTTMITQVWVIYRCSNDTWNLIIVYLYNYSIKLHLLFTSIKLGDKQEDNLS